MSEVSEKPCVKQPPLKDWLTQQESLRKATLLKQRKVSAQLKLEMVQRELQHLRRSDAERKFYRLQLRELSGELRELSRSLEGGLSLSFSNPAICSSQESLNYPMRKQRTADQPNTANCKVIHRRLGELRAVASLSSLNTKISASEGGKDTKLWKSPFKFLGNLMDNAGIRRRLWRSSSSKKLQSDENIFEEKLKPEVKGDEFATSSDSSDEDQQEECATKVTSNRIWKPPVVRKVSGSKRTHVNPAVMAEIEDFEKMAAQYIQQHS